MKPTVETAKQQEVRLATLLRKAPLSALERLSRRYAQHAAGVLPHSAHRHGGGKPVAIPPWVEEYLRSGGSVDEQARVLDWTNHQKKDASRQIQDAYSAASAATWRKGFLNAAVGPLLAGLAGGFAGTAIGVPGAMTVGAAAAAALWAARARAGDEAGAFNRETRWSPRGLELAHDYVQEESQAAAAWRRGVGRPSAWDGGQQAWESTDGGGANARWWAAHAIFCCISAWPDPPDEKVQGVDLPSDRAFAAARLVSIQARPADQLRVLLQLRADNDTFARASLSRAVTDARDAALTALTWHAVTRRQEPLWTAYEGETWWREHAVASLSFGEAEGELADSL